MLHRAIQPNQKGGGFVVDDGRRSASGASTASHESSNTAVVLENEPRYALIRPQSQPVPVHGNSHGMLQQGMAGAIVDHQALEAIHRYNNSQGYNAHQTESIGGDIHHGRYDAASEGPDNLTPAPEGPLGGASGADGDKKTSKNTNSTAANEKELRELIESNAHRSLESIARDVRSSERTQKAEKAKQLFAMRWLREFCRQDKESVPRNRVYTHYAQRCGTDRVDTLNPASFGKLVRVIFPGIQTRRLGVRGESKYHYVNLTLRDDPHGLSLRPPSAHANAIYTERANSLEPESQNNAISRVPADIAPFPPGDQTTDHSTSILSDNPSSHGCLFVEANNFGLQFEGKMFTQKLKFSSKTNTNVQDEPMTLPNIYDYVPPKTDVDIADALMALYRTYCTQLIDSVRFVKEKQFARTLGSLSGTLTVPVTRLFTHPNIAPWVKMCDWLMYQQIVRFLSQIALQVIPFTVFSMLTTLSNTLTQQITKNFSNYADHVLQAKLEPATVFSSLLQRLLRVNETAHAAANLLTQDPVRNLMWQDWVRCVKPKRVAESELPECGYEEVYNILTTDVRRLLEPLEVTEWYETGTEYQTDPFLNTRPPTDPSDTTTTAEGVLDRWAVFLRALPGRFPRANTRTLLHCINAVGTASLRDITVNQASSFGSWWITKVWIDEMMLWLAESGGFLECRQLARFESPQHSDFGNPFDGVLGGAEHSTNRHQSVGLGIDFQRIPELEPTRAPPRHSTEPPTATFRFPSKTANKAHALAFDIHEDNHDDSGIGMSMMSADTNNGSFNFDYGQDVPETRLPVH